jgi:hypothetical protein
MRKCTRCGDTKTDGSFGLTDAGNPRSWCKECHRAYKTAWKKTPKGRASEKRYQRSSKRRESNARYREGNREKIRAGNRAASRRHYKKNRPKLLERQRHRRKAHPEEGRAHRMVGDALFFGLLKKPKKCEDCGESRSLQAHHEDHWKPLDVDWLCAPCHAERRT